MSALLLLAVPVVNALMLSLKLTVWSRHVRILMIKIEFDPGIGSSV